MAVDHGAAELQIAHAALEFVGGGLGILHGKMREAGIAVGPLLDFLGQEIVRCARGAHGCAASRSACTPGPAIASTARAMPALSIDLAAAARRNRSGRVEAAPFWPARRRPLSAANRPRRRIQEMLLERDLLDHAFLARASGRIRAADLFCFLLYRILG